MNSNELAHGDRADLVRGDLKVADNRGQDVMFADGSVRFAQSTIKWVSPMARR